MQGLTNVADRTATRMAVDKCRSGGEIQERNTAHDREQGPFVEGSVLHRFLLYQSLAR